MPSTAELPATILSELQKPLGGIDDIYLLYLALYLPPGDTTEYSPEQLDAIKRPFVIDAVTTVFNLSIEILQKDPARNQTKINLLRSIINKQGAGISTFSLEKVLIQAGQPLTWEGLRTGSADAVNTVIDKLMYAYMEQED